MIDLDKLGALARAATPGPWRVIPTDTQHCGSISIEEHGQAIETIATYCGAYEGHGAANAAFIAATDPTTVLALIDRVRQAEANYRFMVEREKAICERCKERIAIVERNFPQVSNAWHPLCAECDRDEAFDHEEVVAHEMGRFDGSYGIPIRNVRALLVPIEREKAARIEGRREGLNAAKDGAKIVWRESDSMRVDYPIIDWSDAESRVAKLKCEP